ncbi:hypothetical protein MKX01_037506 [Papaver californicum]|nr:hypothetical protein MKX01_037506 [Papaver californicum]
MLFIRELFYATGPEFGKYMPRFCKYLEMGLQNFEEYKVFAVSVEVVGDICCALDDKILPFFHGIMSHLLAYFQCGVMHPSMTPLILFCSGNMYLPYAMPMIQVASEICAKMDPDNEEKMNYGNQLRSGIFDAYQSLCCLMLVISCKLLNWCSETREESVSKAAISAMEDLAHTLGPNVKMLFKDRAFYADFLRECLHSDDYKMKEIATWTERMMKRVFICELGQIGKGKKLLVINLKPASNFFPIP